MGIIKELIKTGVKYFDDKEISKKENPIGAMNRIVDLDIQPNPYDITAHLAVYTINVYAYAAQKAIARDVAATPFLLQQEKLVNGEYTFETVERTPLNELFTRPNPTETFQELIERVVIALVGTGDGYLIRDKLDKELYYVKPDFVSVKTDASGNLKGYQISQVGLTYNADYMDLIHFKLANPNGEYFGFPPSEVIKDQIMTKLALSGYIKGFFKNNALAGTTFSTDQELTKEQRAATRAELNRLLGGYDNAFKSAILEKGQKMDKLSHNMKDLVPKEVNDMIREDVGAAYGVPPAKIGLYGGMTFENADIMDKTYMRDTVRPIARSIGNKITHQILFYENGSLRLWWNEDDVKVLQDDLNDKVKRNIDLKNSGIITTNEARQSLEYEASTEDGADDLGKNTNTREPINPDAPLLLTNEEDDDEKDKNKYSNWLRKYTKTRFDYETKDIAADRIRIKKQNELKLVNEEKILEKVIKRFWNEQLTRILEKIQMISVDGKINRLLLYGIINKGAESDATDIFNLLAENEAFAQTLRPYLKATVLRSGQRGMLETGIVGVFNNSDPQVLIELEKAINRVVGINQTSFDKIIKLMQADYATGETVNTIADNIRRLYKDFSKSRAMTIARTETNAVVSGAKLVGGIQAGATHKEWFATLDGETRIAHTGADGQIVPIREAFEVGGEKLMYPGDPNGSAGNVISCRCSHVNLAIEEGINA